MKPFRNLTEIKRWKNAHSDLIKFRKDLTNQKKNVKLVSLKKNGEESKLHDATKFFDDEQTAHDYHASVRKLNPNRNIRHNLYIDGKLSKTLDEENNLDEISRTTLRDYQNRAATDYATADVNTRYGEQEDREYWTNKKNKRAIGLQLAQKQIKKKNKFRCEEQDLNEISKDLATSYQQKSNDQFRNEKLSNNKIRNRIKGFRQADQIIHDADHYNIKHIPLDKFYDRLEKHDWNHQQGKQDRYQRGAAEHNKLLAFSSQSEQHKKLFNDYQDYVRGNRDKPTLNESNINEISDDKIKQYVSAATDDLHQKSVNYGFKAASGKMDKDDAKKIKRRREGIRAAFEKINNRKKDQ